MVSTRPRSFQLLYEDGWTEAWYPREGATPESLVALGVQLLREAGLDVISIGVRDETGRFGTMSPDLVDDSQDQRNHSFQFDESVNETVDPAKAKRDRYNARRREKRRLAKEASQQTSD